MAKIKKVDPKMTIKQEAMASIKETFEAQGFTVGVGTDYGMTSTTLVINHSTADIQIKLITPKAGVDRYETVE